MFVLVYKTTRPVANGRTFSNKNLNLVVVYYWPCPQIKQKATSMISIVATRGRISNIV